MIDWPAVAKELDDDQKPFHFEPSAAAVFRMICSFELANMARI
jgi:hypothetical protein